MRTFAAMAVVAASSVVTPFLAFAHVPKAEMTIAHALTIALNDANTGKSPKTALND